MRTALVFAGLFSGCVNLLALASPLFMLAIYDHVIPSRSSPTLAALLLLVVGLFAFLGFLDFIRARIMTWTSSAVDQTLSRRVFRVIALAPVRARVEHDALKPAQEMDQIRAFLTGGGPIALFDLPWSLAYLAVCFLLHPSIGLLASSAMIFVTGLALLNHLLTRSLARSTSLALARRNRFGEAAHRNAEALSSMGMLAGAAEKWDSAHGAYVELQHRAGNIASVVSSVSKTFRLMLQALVLALGAFLVIDGDLTGGAIVAGSIVVSRALAPAEQIIANWRALAAARLSWRRLQDLFALIPDEVSKTAIPAPRKTLAVESVTLSPPGGSKPCIQNVSFRVPAASIVGILGPSGSGKTSLVRAIVGAWPLARGEVRLDGAALNQWTATDRGRYIGYLPQGVELFSATVAENIARFDSDAEDRFIIEAATAAGVHDLIVSLPDGYDTLIGEGGIRLSAGQQQRIALARALYRNPFLVVLDEPNSNLDADGDKALAASLEDVRRRGGIALVAAHRINVLPSLDYVLVLEAGVAKAFGPRDAILRQAPQPTRVSAGAALKIVDSEGAVS